MHMTFLAGFVSTSLLLAPAVPGTEPDPREDLNLLISHAVSLLETKQYAKAIETLADPEALKKALEREKKSIDELAASFAEDKAGPLLEVLKSIRGTKPELSDEGRRASFSIDHPEIPKKKLIFAKNGKLWSLQN
jgi:hypothetical protein